MSSNIDILKVIESKLDGKVQIEPGHLSTGTVTVTDGLYRDVLKAMVAADEKTAIVTMTGIDLRRQHRRLLPHTHIQRFPDNQSRSS